MQDSSSEPTNCIDFIPSFSDQGFCFSRNRDGIDNIFKNTSYTETFKKILLYDKDTGRVRKNKGSGFQHQYSFVVDNGYYNDFKRGLREHNDDYNGYYNELDKRLQEKDEYYTLPETWNKLLSTHTNFVLSVHSPLDIAEIGGNGIRVQSGYETTIRINLMELYSDESIKGIDIGKRNCLFSDENEKSKLFLHYSKQNCELECKLDYAENLCGCRPWDYPRSQKQSKNDKEQPICDFFSSSCFRSAMKHENMQHICFETCPSSCNAVQYTISTERVPLDANRTICADPMHQKVTDSENDIGNAIWNHIFGLPVYPNRKYRWFKKTPIRQLIRMFPDIMLNRTHTQTDAEYCTEKVLNDIAVVNVIVNSRNVVKMVQNLRVTFTDKLANFGK